MTSEPITIPECFYNPELRAAGILELSCARPSDLDNPIHPIFRHGNFYRLPVASYNALAPALRLASLLITEVHCLEWWVSVLHGPRLPIPGVGKRHGVLLSVDPITTSHLHTTRSFLLNLANHITFRFKSQGEEHHAYGMQLHSTSDRSHQVIEFSSRFQEFIEDGYLANSSVSHQLRFLFFFALNMVHELSHAVFDTRVDSNLSKEPYTDRDVESGLFYTEMGDSWERFAFGCKIQPLDGEKGYSEDCRYGLHRFTPSTHYEDSVFGAVPMGYVCALMSKSRWRAVRKKGVRMLRCPQARICSYDITVREEAPH